MSGPGFHDPKSIHPGFRFGVRRSRWPQAQSDPTRCSGLVLLSRQVPLLILRPMSHKWPMTSIGRSAMSQNRGITMVNSRETAAKNAERSTGNVPGTCQLWTRTQFGAPSAGDQDRDGDADAVDGWKSEPTSRRHPGDKNPPRGVPVAWSGGSKGFGHRAISLGGGMIRSTDAGGSGKVATVSIDYPERAWGHKYLGWSETISGQVIPIDPPPAPPVPPTPKPAEQRTIVRRAIRKIIKATPPGSLKKRLQRINQRLKK